MTLARLDRIAEDWDVVVIGAGPAGAVAAILLARRGHRVLLVDKDRFPRYKVCGGCFSARAAARLAKLSICDDLRAWGAAPVQQFRVMTRAHSLDVNLLGGFALERSIFDARLAESAVDAGVTFTDGTRAALGSTRRDARKVLLSNGVEQATVQARLVIAAEGLARRLTNHEGIPVRRRRGAQRIGAGAILNSAHVVETIDPGVIYMAVRPAGYVGVTRSARNRAIIGAALDPDYARKMGGVGTATAAILHSCGFPATPSMENLLWKGTPALNSRLQRLGSHRLMVLGDAAGYVEPFTGEGIGWAMDSAAAVCDIAERGIRDFDQSLIVEWERAYRRQLSGAMRRCRYLTLGLRYPHALDRAITLLNRVPSISARFARSVTGASDKEWSVSRG